MFKDKADMDYYDTECAAHQVLKEGNKSLTIDGVLTVYYTPEVIGGL